MLNNDLKAKMTQAFKDFPEGLHFVIVKNTEFENNSKTTPAYNILLVGTGIEKEGYSKLAKFLTSYHVKNMDQFENMRKELGEGSKTQIKYGKGVAFDNENIDSSLRNIYNLYIVNAKPI